MKKILVPLAAAVSLAALLMTPLAAMAQAYPVKPIIIVNPFGAGGALDQLARNLAHEYGPDGVRVNCIAPGLVRTEFARALWENPQTLERATRTAPLRRIGEPDEIAGAAVYLASKASSFTTGQTIVCDGGVTI